jgi:hypothetical protein
MGLKSCPLFKLVPPGPTVKTVEEKREKLKSAIDEQIVYAKYVAEKGVRPPAPTKEGRAPTLWF